MNYKWDDKRQYYRALARNYSWQYLQSYLKNGLVNVTAYNKVKRLWKIAVQTDMYCAECKEELEKELNKKEED